MNQIDPASWGTPLAQDYSEVFDIPDPDVYTATPSLIRLPSGRLMCSFALMTRVNILPGNPDREIRTLFWTSDDGGKTWLQIGEVGLGDGLAFVSRDRLYLLCNRPGRNDIVLVVSDDEGATWSEPQLLFEGRFWNTFTPHAIRDNTLYWSFGAGNGDGNFNRTGSRIVLVAGDLAAENLMDPLAWRISPHLTYPGTPEGLSAGLAARTDPNPAADIGDHWLEPNVVNIDGRVRVYVRLRVDGIATPHLCAICDVDDDGEKLDLRFTQFHPLPGSCYFHVIRDEPDGYFWTPVNLPTRAQDVDWARQMAPRLIGGAATKDGFSCSCTV